MLNKENLLCTSTGAPEPGYVPAKLTIGHTKTGLNGRRDLYGYQYVSSTGKIEPDVVNGTTIYDCYAKSSSGVTTTVPFYYDGVKYQNDDPTEPLLSIWRSLVGQTVDIWLSGGGVKTLISQAIAALLGGSHDAWEGASASGGRNFGNSRLHSGNEKLTRDFVRSYGIYKYRGSSRKFWNENPVFSFFRNSLYVLAGIKRFTVQRACSQLHGDGEIHHGDYERFQAATRFGCNWRVVQFWRNESYPRRRGNQNSHSAVAVNAASVKEVA